MTAFGRVEHVLQKRALPDSRLASDDKGPAATAPAVTDDAVKGVAFCLTGAERRRDASGVTSR